MKLCFSPKSTPYSIYLLLLPPVLLALTYLFPNPKTDLSSLLATSGPANYTVSKPDFRLLIGILTLPSRFELRSFLRLAYSAQPITTAHVDVRFVFCNLTKEEETMIVSLEIMRYNDIIILNCTESMNSGKTYKYFSSLPTIFRGEERYDYVMKTDDDTYFWLDSLVESLKDKPREDLYYGAGLPNFGRKDFPAFMLGMGYILSWDLIEWVATSEIPKSEPAGPEDVLTGKWLNMGNKARNRYSVIPKMYDYRGPKPEDFIPETIAVHQLKERSRWVSTLKYFNVTDGIKHSKLYHLP